MLDWVKKYRAGLLPLLILLFLFLNWITRRKGMAGAMETIKYNPNAQKPNSVINFFKNTEYSQLAPLLSAQAQHETGNFSSSAYISQNNMYGMKHAVIRDQLGVNDGRTYRTYANPVQSMQDMLMYLRAVNFPTTVLSVQEYVQELKNRGYFGDSVANYYKNVDYYYKRNML